MDAMDELYFALHGLRSEKNTLDPEYLKDVKDLFMKTMEDLSKTTGEYLHKIEERKPSKQALKKMIDAVPSSLSYKNEKGQLPIQQAVWKYYTVAYIPLLAIEGVRNNVGGGDKRGGLLSLVEDPTFNSRRTCNVLQLLFNVRSNPPEPYDTACLNVIKELKESNLFLEQDIQDCKLFTWSCRTTWQLRFDYLAEMDPEGLKHHRFQEEGKPPIHVIINANNSTSESFQLFLTTALKHHPEDICLLFQKVIQAKLHSSVH